MPYIGCLLTKTAAQSISNNSTTIVTFDEERHDTHGLHSLSTNTGRITIPSNLGGFYLLTGLVQFAANGTGVRRAEIWVNGAAVARAQRPAVAGAALTVQVILPYELAAGSYAELRVYQDSGGNLDVEHSNTPYTPLFGADYLGA